MQYRRLKLKAGKYHFWVKIFKTKADMRAYWQDYDKRTGGVKEGYDKAGGVTLAYRIFKTATTNKIEPEIGQILVSEEQMGGSTMGHELIHAALHAYEVIYKSRNIKNMEQEENFAYLFSDMHNELVNKMYDKKIW